MRMIESHLPSAVRVANVNDVTKMNTVVVGDVPREVVRVCLGAGSWFEGDKKIGNERQWFFFRILMK